jgi:hypothetical protein
MFNDGLKGKADRKARATSNEEHQKASKKRKRCRGGGFRSTRYVHYRPRNMDRSCESPAAEIAASMGFDEKRSPHRLEKIEDFREGTRGGRLTE